MMMPDSESLNNLPEFTWVGLSRGQDWTLRGSDSGAYALGTTGLV